MTWITPSLRVTGEYQRPEAAVAIIKSRGIADVATLDDARSVMRLLGMDESSIEDRIHFALTGEVLSA